jgi:hypothetical protein
MLKWQIPKQLAKLCYQPSLIVEAGRSPPLVAVEVISQTGTGDLAFFNMKYSGIWRRVVWFKFTDVFEECATSIFKAEKIVF